MTPRRGWLARPGQQVTVHGNMTVVERVGSSVVQNFDQPPLYHLGLATRAPLDIDREKVREHPSQLLNPRYPQPEFVGRSALLGDLREWRGAKTASSALLLHGPGGQGKSRVAEELARESQEAGWTVFQVRHGSDRMTRPHAQSPVPEADGGSAGLLLIVDYADRWPGRDLTDFMTDCTGQGDPALRMLFIARAATGWWSTPSKHLWDLDAQVEERELAALTEEIDRTTLFAAARDHFGAALGVTAPPRTPPELSGDGFATVLAVHMAALAEVDAQRRGQDPPRSPAEISTYLLLREQTYWEQLRAAGQVSISPGTFARTVYAATLTGALPWPQAREVLTRLDVSPGDPGQALDDHRVVYPARAQNTVLEPLYPDRLGEDFIALMLPNGPTSSLLSTAWATQAPQQLFSVSDESVEGLSWPRRALITLIEAAQRWEHVAQRQLVPLLTDRPALVHQAGSAALSALVRIRSLPPELLDAIELSLPLRSPHLDAGAAEIARHITPYRLSRAGRYAALPAWWIHGRLAHRFDGVGENAAAVTQIEETLRLLEELTPHGDGHRARVALYLDWAGIIYERNGDFGRALECSRRCVALYEELAAKYKDQPEKYGEVQSGLTYALANLSGRKCLAPAEQLKVAERAVELCRGLVHGDSVPDDVELAGALHNLGVALHALGRYEESLAPLQEATAIRREQAAGNFAFYAEYLEQLLGTLTNHLALVDQRGAARSAARERVGVLHRLAEADPGRFTGLLAEAEQQLEDLR
ncbi:tetratricopeptide repeat protein [Streptomyces sp. NPDC040724]|uniref:tetratricopeptide repeat protein n=1 Tax=Streptomyces sp. NPDC040724 TaxID=3155612 RepID=UPI0033D3DAB0